MSDELKVRAASFVVTHDELGPLARGVMEFDGAWAVRATDEKMFAPWNPVGRRGDTGGSFDTYDEAVRHATRLARAHLAAAKVYEAAMQSACEAFDAAFAEEVRA